MKRNRVMKQVVMLAAFVFMSVACAATAWAATRLDTVEDTYWDDDNTTVARWEEVEDVYEYELYLYRDETHIKTLKTKKTSMDLDKYLTKEGEYTFKVRALARNNSGEYRDGYWSDESDSCYVSEDFAELMRNGGVVDTKNSGPGAPGEGSGVTKETSVVYTAEWVQDSTGWWYRMADGSYPANGWWQQPDTGIWYFLNEQGYLVTGWIDWNGNRYYCQPSGAMVVGDVVVDGVQYHFDASGAMQAS